MQFEGKLARQNILIFRVDLLFPAIMNPSLVVNYRQEAGFGSFAITVTTMKSLVWISEWKI